MSKELVSIIDVKDHLGQEVTIGAWVANKSGKGKLAFLQLRDGTAFFQGVGKQNWYPSSESIFWGQYNRPYNQYPKWHVGNEWTENNPDAYLPRNVGYSALSRNSELQVAQTRYLQNVAYIRLKNLQIGYNLPKNIVGKAHMQRASVYISAENIWCYSPLYKRTHDIDVTNISGSDPISPLLITVTD